LPGIALACSTNWPPGACYFTEEQVYAAMLKHEGARSLVAKELGCHVRTVDEYIKRFPSLQDIMHDRKVGICDHSEEVLKKARVSGNTNVAQFQLKNLHPDYGPKGGNKTENSSNHSSCFLSGDRLWPLLDLASKLPVSRQRFTQRIAVASPITNCRAAARAAAPPSTTWITRTRRSFEYPIAASSAKEATESYSPLVGNPPRFTETGNRVAVFLRLPSAVIPMRIVK
jgi:hypothetical protein